MKTILGGYLINEQLQRIQFSVVFEPDDVSIEKMLSSVKSANSGVIEIQHNPIPNFGSIRLTIYIENGSILPMLEEIDEFEDCNVRTLCNKSLPNNLISILGEMYPLRAVTDDFELAYKIVKEFSATGTVSGDVLT